MNLRKNVFKEPPLVAFKKQKNLKDLLIRAKVPGPIKERSERKLKGMFKCNQEKCTSCPYIKEGKTIKINKTTTWQHNKKFTCNTSNIVYLIECKKEMCQKRYIGHGGPFHLVRTFPVRHEHYHFRTSERKKQRVQRTKRIILYTKIQHII